MSLLGSLLRPLRASLRAVKPSALARVTHSIPTRLLASRPRQLSTASGASDASADGAATPDATPDGRAWVLGKTWDKRLGRFITQAELGKWVNSTRSLRIAWRKSAKRRARKKRRLARKREGRYNF